MSGTSQYRTEGVGSDCLPGVYAIRLQPAGSTDFVREFQALPAFIQIPSLSYQLLYSNSCNKQLVWIDQGGNIPYLRTVAGKELPGKLYVLLKTML